MESLEKLTKEKALSAVESIRNIIHNDETAHQNEDSVNFWFISCVAAGMYEKEEAKEIAIILQEIAEMDFCRWYT